MVGFKILCLRMPTVGLVGRLKNSEMLMHAYGGVGGWVKRLGNAYRSLRWNKWVGRPKTHKYLKSLKNDIVILDIISFRPKLILPHFPLSTPRFVASLKIQPIHFLNSFFGIVQKIPYNILIATYTFL